MSKELGGLFYTHNDLLARYSICSHDGEKDINRQTLYKWRKEKGFPEPQKAVRRNLWLKIDIHKWEHENGFGFLHAE